MSDTPGRRPLWRTVLTPRWTGLLVLALAIASVMTVMGVWQVGVYRSKTADATAERAAAAPVPLRSLFSIDEGLPSKAVGRRVTVEGTWAPAADQVFIADRLHDGRDGFWVVSPLKLSDTDAVMVVRGWVASVTDPAAAAPVGPVSLTGAVISSEAEDSSGDAAKGRVLSSLRIPTIVHLVKYRIYDAFVVQGSVESGAVPSPAPASVVPPPPPTDHAGLRNIAYAFQWWIFAAFTLWMWARMVLDAHRDPEDTDPPDVPGPDGPDVDGAAVVGDRAEERVESSGTVSA
ncbi:SURF1 family protein [Kribbella shirazensis]|uniref:SURF1-like protein n=1 Tax=Kribbella shirazensis TaxID=1105143 RepID=A0A7X5ZZA8_9ACTN|nr:SURF1 family protein [Kribbella shirazensis]NIK55475.1 cytochrome oxidase assembly protein ShyY1 [Kribbella shirazensis]